jgi:hypothetical protein
MHETTTTALALCREALQALTYEHAIRRRTMTQGAPARAAARLALRRVIAQMEVERAEEMAAEAAARESRPRLDLAQGALQTAKRELDRAEADVRATVPSRAPEVRGRVLGRGLTDLKSEQPADRAGLPGGPLPTRSA